VCVGERGRAGQGDDFHKDVWAWEDTPFPGTSSSVSVHQTVSCIFASLLFFDSFQGCSSVLLGMSCTAWKYSALVTLSFLLGSLHHTSPFTISLACCTEKAQVAAPQPHLPALLLLYFNVLQAPRTPSV
jgi:hypothetical protein